MQDKKKLITPNWKPEVYNRLASVQATTALKVLEVLQIREDAHVLDVGCGDGKISSLLAERATRGYILGLDKSFEMIDFANKMYKNEKCPNLEFSLKDAQDIHFHETFNLIFSSFALQWLEDKNSFLAKAYRALRNNGQICIVMPLNISPELEQATKTVTKSPNWAPFFKKFHPNWYFIEGDALKHLVKENFFKITYSHKVIEKVHFPSLKEFKDYVLLWFPYLTPLRNSLKATFFSQIIGEYCKMLPPGDDGSMSMEIPIISLIASKAGPPP